jgi:hypothetical protein
MLPSKKNETYFPLSRGSAMSATHPDPIEMTADPPVDYGQIRPGHANVFHARSWGLTHLQSSQEQQQPILASGHDGQAHIRAEIDDQRTDVYRPTAV